MVLDVATKVSLAEKLESMLTSYCMCDSVLNMKVELPSKFLDTLNITRKITLTHKYSEILRTIISKWLKHVSVL